jgi:hypothetical protein
MRVRGGRKREEPTASANAEAIAEAILNVVRDHQGDPSTLARTLNALGADRMTAAVAVGKALGWAKAWTVAPTAIEASGIMGDERVRMMFDQLVDSENISNAPGGKASVRAFGPDKVDRVLAYSAGHDTFDRSDDSDWLLVCRLVDGRVAFVSMRVDITAINDNGFVASASAVVHTDLAQLVRFGIGTNDRERLGLS